MRFYYDNKFNFLGFSYSMSMFGVLAGVVALIGSILIMLFFIPLYPLWYYLAMKNWDRLVVTDPNDKYFHILGVKPRVFSMTRFEWKMLLVTWVICGIMGGITVVLNAKKEKRQKELDRIEMIQRERKAREDSIRYFKWLNGEIELNPARRVTPTQSPSEELEYFERNRDDYLDDPEDILRYPDEIFDFYED